MRVQSLTGCGFFPWFPEDAALPSLAPVSLTLTEAMRWYWRVREWLVDIDVTWGDGSSVYHVTGSGTVEVKNGIIVHDKESDLTIGGEHGALILGVNWTHISGPGSDTTGQLLFTMFSDGPGTGVATNEDETEWAPYLFCELDFAGGGVSTLESATSATAQTIIDGETAAMYADTPGQTWSGSITIDPSLFWKYGNRDESEPIWDSATGAQSLNPYPLEAST